MQIANQLSVAEKYKDKEQLPALYINSTSQKREVQRFVL
jgi:hypothetical protein